MTSPLDAIATLMAHAPAKPRHLEVPYDIPMQTAGDWPDLNDYLGDVGVLEDPGDGEPRPPMPELALARHHVEAAAVDWRRDPVGDLRDAAAAALVKCAFTSNADRRRYEAGIAALLDGCDSYEAAWLDHHDQRQRAQAWNDLQLDLAWRRYWAGLALAEAGKLHAEITAALGTGETK